MFGTQPGLAVTAPKSALGHGFGAAGAFGVLIAVLSLRTAELPPTRGLADVDPDCDLDHVRGEPRVGRLRRVVVNASGFGGQNAAVVISSPPEPGAS